MLTGGAGFVGSRLAKRLLSEGHEVHLVIRENSDLTQINSIVDSVVLHIHDGSTKGMMDIVNEARPKIVFHLASLFISEHNVSDVAPLIESNILFGVQLLEAMNAVGVKKIINTGTSWQHFNGDKYNPVNLYASTKQAFEDIAKYYAEAHGFQIITLKLSDTYGESDPRKKLVHLLLKAAVSGEVLKMSPGQQQIDLVHVDDVVDAYVGAGKILFNEKNKTNKSYSIKSGRPITVKELVEIVESAVGHTLNIKWGGRQYRKREVMDVVDVDPVLGEWDPKIGLASGLRNMIVHQHGFMRKKSSEFN